MTTRQRIIDFIGTDSGAKLLEPEIFDAAIIGVAESCGQPSVVCYSRTRVIEILEGMGMDHDEANEYFDFNIGGAYMGDGTPTFVDERFAE